MRNIMILSILLIRPSKPTPERMPCMRVLLLTDGEEGTPRFPVPCPATDAGPGAYATPEFTSRGPAYSIPPRPKMAIELPESPGPGQYIDVQLSVLENESGVVAEGFGNRNCPRFAVGEDRRWR